MLRTPVLPAMTRLADGAVAGTRATLRAWRRAAGGRCVACRGWCEGGLCAWCHGRFAGATARCAGCALPWGASRPMPEGDGDGSTHCERCRRTPPPWSRMVAGVDYGYPWDRLLAGLKFHDRLDLADVLLGPLLASLRRQGLAPQSDSTSPPTAADCRLVPIPLSRERLRERGYNQSWELVRRLGRDLSLEARADALFRVRDTGHQLGLHRARRDANLQGAFVVTPRHAPWVRDARIALVDDVLTTGATARAATRALLAAGAREVQVWVVARTP